MPPLFVLTQFNHPDECTIEAFEAADRLRKAGVPMLNQMVLLRGVNDDADTITELGRRLLVMGIKPYYLHQMDAVKGTAHFRVSPRKGVAIMRELRAQASGLLAPGYVIDLPDGGGKVTLAPDYVVKMDESRAWIADAAGRVHEYAWADETEDRA